MELLGAVLAHGVMWPLLLVSECLCDEGVCSRASAEVQGVAGVGERGHGRERGH